MAGKRKGVSFEELDSAPDQTASSPPPDVVVSSAELASALDDDDDDVDEIAATAPDEAPTSPSWPALQPLTERDLYEDLDSLRRRIAGLSYEREVRRFKPLLDVVHEISDREVLRRRLRRIERDRRAYRAAERQALMRREFAYETGADGDAPGIAAHVSRVGSGGFPGTLKETTSQITRDAVRDYPDLEAQLKAGIKTPRSLWYALAIDPPMAPPTGRELRELGARTLKRRGEHDRYVMALVAGMDSDAVLAAKLEAAIRRYLAADAWQTWQEVVRQATEGTRAAVEHRRSRVRWLAERFGCGEHGGWSIAAIARLLLASANDWTRPPCPLLVEKYGAHHDAGDAAGEEKLIEVLRKDLADAKPKKAPGRALGRVGGKNGARALRESSYFPGTARSTSAPLPYGDSRSRRCGKAR